MNFNSYIQPVNCNINSTTTCILIQTFDQLTAILIQQVLEFQFIRPVDCNINSTSTCISIRTFDQLTAILIQQLHVFQFIHLTG